MTRRLQLVAGLVALVVGAALVARAIGFGGEGQAIYSPARIARLVGTEFGDPRARIIQARPDQTEGPPFHPMYRMTLSGRFRQGSLNARTLVFSAVADSLYVWGIAAYEGRTQVWAVDQWPTSYAVARLTPVQPYIHGKMGRGA